MLNVADILKRIYTGPVAVAFGFGRVIRQIGNYRLFWFDSAPRNKVWQRADRFTKHGRTFNRHNPLRVRIEEGLHACSRCDHDRLTYILNRHQRRHEAAVRTRFKDDPELGK